MTYIESVGTLIASVVLISMITGLAFNFFSLPLSFIIGGAITYGLSTIVAVKRNR